MTNLCHGAGGGAFVALYLWENRKEEEQISRITRDETLSRLPVRLATNRIVELTQLRENTRPVSQIIVANCSCHPLFLVFRLCFYSGTELSAVS